MEASKRTPFILPTLQSNLNYAINEVLRRRNTLPIGDTWRSIETLFSILPPSIYNEVEDDYNRIIKLLNNANNGSSVDFLQMVESNAACCEILETYAFPFFRNMYYLLYKGNYLEKGALQPRYPTKKTLSVETIETQ